MKSPTTEAVIVVLLTAGLVSSGLGIPEVKVSLSRVPYQRWSSVFTPELLSDDSFVGSLVSVLRSGKQRFVDIGCGPGTSCSQMLSKRLASRYPSHFEELRGMSAALEEAGVLEFTTEDLVASQYFYELAHVSLTGAETLGCTSVLATGAGKRGVIWHGRNLDFSVPEYRNLTMVVSWVDAEFREAFRTVQFVGENIGATTAMSKGRWTFSYNWRNLHPRPTLDQLVECLQDPDSVAPLGSFTRSLLENRAVDFDMAVRLLAGAKLCAPSYLIVGGLQGQQGAVITSNGDGPQDITMIGDAGNPLSWAVAQANTDVWLPPPAGDDRAGLATEILTSLGQGSVSLFGLWNVMSTPGNNDTRGVLNPTTLYTAVMSAQAGVLSASKR